MASLFSRRPCQECEQYRRELRDEQRRSHELELRLVKAETLAQVHRLDVERLEARLAARETLPAGGGFVPMEKPEPEPPQQAADASDFATRMDEIFGTGIDLGEYIRRQEKYRQESLAGLEAERTQIREEMQRIP